MHEEPTQNIGGADGRSFEERVFARFDNLDDRLQRLEARSYDTKPIWEQALKEIADMRIELAETKRELVDMKRQVTKRLDRFEAVVFQTRSDLGDLEDRVEKLEAKPTQ